jgi:hypothetical protein
MIGATSSVRQGDSALLVDPHRHARLELGRGPNRIGAQGKVVDVVVSDRARCVAQDERFVAESRNRAPSAQLDSLRNPRRGRTLDQTTLCR